MESGVSLTSLDPGGEDRFQWLPRELGGAQPHQSRDGRPPQEVPYPD
jgi:hypothetical protein